MIALVYATSGGSSKSSKILDSFQCPMKPTCKCFCDKCIVVRTVPRQYSGLGGGKVADCGGGARWGDGGMEEGGRVVAPAGGEGGTGGGGGGGGMHGKGAGEARGVAEEAMEQAPLKTPVHMTVG